jgi:2-iminobutanoate/2-iminopropanoate deaminase
MPKKEIVAPNVVKVENTIYFGGQTGLGTDGKPIARDFVTQAEAAYRSLVEVLKAGGATTDDVVYLTTYVTTMEDHDTNMEVRKKFFETPPPGRSTVVAKSMGQPGSLIEMHGVAVIDD